MQTAAPEVTSPSEEPEGPLVAAPAQVHEAPREPASRRYVVAAVGDSLTDARSRGGRYLALLRERCPQSVFENFGRGGDMVNMMRRRFESDFTPRVSEFTHLLIFGGVNDLYSDLSAGRTPARVEADLTFMYDAAHAHGLRVVALTVAPWGGFRHYNERRGAATRELNDWIRAARARGAVDHVVDAYALLSCGDPEVLCPEYMRPSRDGLHFGTRGHEVLGEALHRDVFADCL